MYPRLVLNSQTCSCLYHSDISITCVSSQTISSYYSFHSISLCNSGQPRIFYVLHVGLKFMILLHLFPKSWDHRHVLSSTCIFNLNWFFSRISQMFTVFLVNIDQERNIDCTLLIPECRKCSQKYQKFQNPSPRKRPPKWILKFQCILNAREPDL